ncbi:MAG: hemerythrin domain-containing protein [Pseudomonadales bacterium]|nr:hemerythrin domain-containing protein [Pseudomonadales bacterium]
MPGILAYLSEDHAKCDEQFAAAEEMVSKGNWEQAGDGFRLFAESLEHHLAMEEQVLFRYLERAMGGPVGPVNVMKMEHTQMRELVQAMAEKLKAGDKDGFLGVSETLLVLMQQHNLKEEQILYPMAERALAADQGKVIEDMDKV